MNYYNDHAPEATQWVRELIRAGELPPGEVDDRSVLDVAPENLRGFCQCHFFAGIGGWPYAVRIAGLDHVAGLWSASLPCQPLSCAGSRQGHADERHLWPAFFDLVAECRPAIIVGEQVASRDGREWLAGVRLDLESLGYAFGAADLPAACVGAPHRRQRLFWVGHSDGAGLEGRRRIAVDRADECAARQGSLSSAVADAAYTDGGRRERDEEARAGESGERRGGSGVSGVTGGVGDSEGRGCRVGGDEARTCGGGHVERAGWTGFDVVACRDGKARRFERQSLALAARLSARVDALRHAGLAEDQIKAALSTYPLVAGQVARNMLLRGYGNAIVPQVAALFLEAALC